jgi:hypothetical protein
VNQHGKLIAGSAVDALDEEGDVRFQRSNEAREDKNEEDKRWHRTSTTDEASRVGDGKETGGGY